MQLVRGGVIDQITEGVCIHVVVTCAAVEARGGEGKGGLELVVFHIR